MLIQSGDFGEMFVPSGAALPASQDEDNYASGRQRGRLHDLISARIFRECGWTVWFAAALMVTAALFFAWGAWLVRPFPLQQRVATPVKATAPVGGWMDQVI